MVRREAELLTMLLRGRIIYARTDEDKEFLRLNNADALLLSHGKILVSEAFEKNNLGLIRKIIHEEIEAIMQIMEEEDRYTYSSIVNMILSRKVPSPRTNKLTSIRDIYLELFPNSTVQNVSNKLLANHIIATAFELLIPVRNKLLSSNNELSENEQLFLEAITPVIDSNKHNYFTSIFWDRYTREDKIRIAMANGQTFYKVASNKLLPLATKGNRRTPAKREQDRKALYDLLEEKEWTIVELSRVLKNTHGIVCEDLIRTGLMGHRNLKINVKDEPTGEELESHRLAVEDVLKDGPHTVADVSKITHIVQPIIWLIIREYPDLKNRHNLTYGPIVRASVVRTQAKPQDYPALLEAALNRGLHTPADLASVTGILILDVQNCIRETPALARHSHLIHVRGNNTPPEDIVKIVIASLEWAIEQTDAYTAEEISALTEVPLGVVRYYLKENPGLNEARLNKNKDRLDSLMAAKGYGKPVTTTDHSIPMNTSVIPYIEITKPSNGSLEENNFAATMLNLARPLWREFADKAARISKIAPSYQVSGQSLILYADDILESTLIVDMEHTIKNMLSRYSILSGGKVIIFAKKEVNAAILKNMIMNADSKLTAIIITQRDMQTSNDEISIAENLIKYARAKGAKDILALIKGPAAKAEPEAFTDLAKEKRIPIIAVGREKGVYSFAQALSIAIEMKRKNGAKGWFIMLPPIKSLTDDIRQRYEEYQRSLQALVAA